MMEGIYVVSIFVHSKVSGGNNYKVVTFGLRGVMFQVILNGL